MKSKNGILSRLSEKALLTSLRSAEQHHGECVDYATDPTLTGAKHQRAIKNERNARQALRRLRDERWRRYEQEKQMIREQNLTPTDYEKSIRALSERLGL